MLIQILGSNFSEQQLELVRPGTMILKAVLVIDGLLLFCVVYCSAGNASRRSAYIPMWTGDPSTTPPRLHHFYCLTIFGLMLFGLVLRTISLNTDLWMDEVFTLIRSVRPGFGEILAIYSGDNQHTLYSLLAKFSVQLFGEYAWSLRLPALMFGVASIWATARVTRLTFGTREAILAAMLCTISYHHIWFSQNARGYTVLLFVALMATDCLLRGLETGRWRYWIGYAVLISLGAFAHLTGVFIAIAHAMVIAALLVKEGQLGNGRWKPIVAILLSAWLTLHFYALTIPQIIEFFNQSGSDVEAISVDWQNPLWLVAETLQQIGVDISVWWPGLIAALVVAAWIGYLFVRRDWVFTFAAFLPAILTVLVLVTLERNLWPRMFFNQIGFIALFLVTALVVTGDYVKSKITTDKPTLSVGLVVIPTLVLCMVSILTLPKLYKYPKQDYQGARDFVQQRATPTDTVLGLHMAGRVYELYYAPYWPKVDTADELVLHRSKSGHTWVLYTLPRFIMQAKPELAKMLEAEFEVVRTFPGSLSDGEIIVARTRSKPLEKQ